MIKKIIASVVTGVLVWHSGAASLAQAALYPVLDPGRELQSREKSGFYNPHDVRARLDAQLSVVKNLKERERRQEGLRFKSIQHVISNVQQSVLNKLMEKDQLEQEMERRQKAGAAIFGQGGEFTFVKYGDGRTVWFKGGVVSRIENERLVDARGNVSLRTMNDMEYNNKGLLTSYSATQTDPSGHTSTIRWFGATYTEDSVAYGGEGTAYRKLMTGYTQEITDDRGNVQTVDWRGATYNEQNQLTSYRQTSTDIYGQASVTEWSGATYDTNNQLVGFREIVTQANGLKRERSWSGATYKKNPAFVNPTQTPGQQEYLLTSYDEDLIDERGQRLLKQWRDGEYNDKGELVSSRESVAKEVQGQQLIQKKDWSGAEYNDRGQLSRYQETVIDFDGQEKSTDWRFGEYDSYGRLTRYNETTIDGRGNLSKREWTAQDTDSYDNQNRLRKSTEVLIDPHGNTSVKDWMAARFDAEGRVLDSTETTIDSSGVRRVKNWSTESKFYDQFGQVSSYVEHLVDEEGNATSRRWKNATYNATGQILFYDEENVDVYGKTSFRRWEGAAYDPFDRILAYTETRRDADGSEEKTLWTQASYDAFGNLLAYHEEFTNSDQELSIKDWSTTSEHYDRFGQLVAYQEMITGFDGISTHRVREHSSYTSLGKLEGYEETVSTTFPAQSFELSEDLKAKLSEDEINRLWGGFTTTENRVWSAGHYDRWGHLAQYSERVVTDHSVTQHKTWTGVMNGRGELLSSDEIKRDSRGLESLTRFQGFSFDHRGRATDSVQIQISSDHPGVMVTTTLTNRTYDRRGTAVSGTEVVVSGGTHSDGTAFSHRQTNHVLEAHMTEGLVTHSKESIIEEGTDPNLQWINTHKVRDLSHITKTGYQEQVVTFAFEHGEKTGEHVVLTERSNMVRNSFGQVIRYRDSIKDPAQGPKPVINERLMAQVNALGELTATLDMTTSASKGRTLSLKDGYTFNLKSQMIGVHERSLKTNLENTLTSFEESWTRNSAYDALGRLTSYQEDTVFHDKNESERVFWSAARFDEQGRVSADKTVSEKFNNATFSGSVEATQTQTRSNITFNVLGQVRSQTEKLSRSDRPTEFISKVTSEMTYDVWGVLATFKERSLSELEDSMSNTITVGLLTTETTRSDVHLDSEGRISSYREVVHQLGRAAGGNVIDHTASTVRVDMEYDDKNPTRLTRYQDRKTDSSTPGLLTVVERVNEQTNAEGLVTQFTETTSRVGHLTHVDEQGHVREQALDDAEIRKRRDIQYNSKGVQTSYKEQAQFSDRPNISENIEWIGTVNEKGQVTSSSQKTTTTKEGLIVEIRQNDQTNMSYNEQGALVSYVDTAKQQIRLESGALSNVNTKIIVRTDSQYDGLGQLIGYQQHETQSGSSHKKTTVLSNGKTDSSGRLVRFVENTTLTSTDPTTPLNVETINTRRVTTFDALGQISETLDERWSSTEPDAITTDHMKDVGYDNQGRQFNFTLTSTLKNKMGTDTPLHVTTKTIRHQTEYDSEGRMDALKESSQKTSAELDSIDQIERTKIKYNAWGVEQSYSERSHSSAAPDRIIEKDVLVLDTDDQGRATAVKDITSTDGMIQTSVKSDIVRDSLGREIKHTERLSSNRDSIVLVQTWAGRFDEKGRNAGFTQTKQEYGSDAVDVLVRSDVSYSSLGFMNYYKDQSSSSVTPDKTVMSSWQGLSFNASGFNNHSLLIRRTTTSKGVVEDKEEKKDIRYLQSGLMDSSLTIKTSSLTPDKTIRVHREKTVYDAKGREVSSIDSEQITAEGSAKLNTWIRTERLNTTYDEFDRIVQHQTRIRTAAAPQLTKILRWNGAYNDRGEISRFTEVSKELGRDEHGQVLNKETTQTNSNQIYDAYHRLISNLITTTDSSQVVKEQQWNALGFDRDGNLLGDDESVVQKGALIEIRSTTHRENMAYDAGGRLVRFDRTSTSSAEPEKETFANHDIAYNAAGLAGQERQTVTETDQQSGGEILRRERIIERTTEFDQHGRLFGYVDINEDLNLHTRTTTKQTATSYNSLGLENGFSQTTLVTSTNGKPLHKSQSMTFELLSFDRLGRASSTLETRTSSDAPDRTISIITDGRTYNQDQLLLSDRKRITTTVQTEMGPISYQDLETRVSTDYDQSGREMGSIDEARRAVAPAVLERTVSKRKFNGMGQSISSAQETTQSTLDGQLNHTTNTEIQARYNQSGQVSNELKTISSSASPGLSTTQETDYLYDSENGLIEVLGTQTLDSRQPPLSSEEAKKILADPQFSTLSDEQKTTITTWIQEGKHFSETITSRKNNFTLDREGRTVGSTETRSSNLTPGQITTIVQTSSGFDRLGNEIGFVQVETGLHSQTTERKNARYDVFGRLKSHVDTITDESSVTKTVELLASSFNELGQTIYKKERTTQTDDSKDPKLKIVSASTSSDIEYDNQNRMMSYHLETQSNNSGTSSTWWRANAFDASGRPSETTEKGRTSSDGEFVRQQQILLADALGRGILVRNSGQTTVSGDYNTVELNLDKNGQLAFNNKGQLTSRLEMGFRHGLGTFRKEIFSGYDDSYDARGRLNHVTEILIQDDKTTQTDTLQQKYNDRNELIEKQTDVKELFLDGSSKRSLGKWTGTYDSQGRLYTTRLVADNTLYDASSVVVGTEHTDNTRNEMLYNDLSQIVSFIENDIIRQVAADGTIIKDEHNSLIQNNTTYDYWGRLVSYHQQGTQGGTAFNEDYQAEEFASTGEAVRWTKKGTRGGSPSLVTQKDSKFDARGRLLAYVQIGISDGQSFRKKASQISYSAKGEILSQDILSESDGGVSNTSQKMTYDAFGRLTSRREQGVDSQGSFTSVTDSFVYDLSGRPVYNKTTRTNALNEDTVTEWTGTYDSSGKLVKSVDLETKYGPKTSDGQQGAVVSTTTRTWTAQEFFSNGILKKGQTVSTTEKPDGTKEESTVTNETLSIDDMGLATSTRTTFENTTTSKEGKKTTSTSTIEKRNIERYTEEEEKEEAAHRAGRIKQYEELVTSSDKPTASPTLVANIKYDAMGVELDSDRASFSSTMLSAVKQNLEAVLDSIFKILKKLMNVVASLMKPEFATPTPTIADHFGSVDVPGLSAGQALTPQDYTLDVVHRSNGQKDQLGRFVSWKETTRSSTSPDKVLTSDVQVAYKGSSQEYETYHSNTTETSPQGIHTWVDDRKDFVYEDGVVKTFKGSMKETAVDAETAQTILDRSYDYTELTTKRDDLGRPIETERTITNDSSAPNLTKKETTTLSYDAEGRVSSRNVTTHQTGHDGNSLIDKTDTINETYTYAAGGRTLTTTRTSWDHAAPSKITVDVIQNQTWDSQGRVTKTKNTQTVTDSTGSKTEDIIDTILKFDAANQALLINREKSSTISGAKHKTTSTLTNRYDTSGRSIETTSNNTETKERTNPETGAADISIRTWTQTVKNLAFDALGRASSVVLWTKNDSSTPEVASRVETQKLTYDKNNNIINVSAEIVEVLTKGATRSFSQSTDYAEFNSDGRATKFTQTIFNDSLAPSVVKTRETSKVVYDIHGNMLTFTSKSSEEGLNSDGTPYKTKPVEIDHKFSYDNFLQSTDQTELNLTLLQELAATIAQKEPTLGTVTAEIQQLAEQMLAEQKAQGTDSADAPTLDELLSQLVEQEKKDVANLKQELSNAMKVGYTSKTTEMTYQNGQLKSAVHHNGLTDERTRQDQFVFNRFGQRIGYKETNLKDGTTRVFEIEFDAYNRAQTTTIDHTEAIDLGDGTKGIRTYTTVESIEEYDKNGRVKIVSSTNKNDSSAKGETRISRKTISYDDVGRMVGTDVWTRTQGPGVDTLSHDTQQIHQFDAMGRSLRTTQTRWTESAPGVTQTTSSLQLYGAGSKNIGALSTMSKTGSLNTSFTTLDINIAFNKTGQPTVNLTWIFGDTGAPDKQGVTRTEFKYNDKGQVQSRNSVTAEFGPGYHKVLTSNESYTYDGNGRVIRTEWARTDSSTPAETSTGVTEVKEFDQHNRALITTTTKTTLSFSEGKMSTTTDVTTERVLSFDGAGLATRLERDSVTTNRDSTTTRTERNVLQRYDDQGRMIYSAADVETEKRSHEKEKRTIITKGGKKKVVERIAVERHTSKEIIETKSFNTLGFAKRTVTTSINLDHKKKTTTVNDSRFTYNSKGQVESTTSKINVRGPNGLSYSYETKTTVKARDDLGNAIDFVTTTDNDSRSPNKRTKEHTTNAKYKDGQLVSADLVLVETGLKGKKKKKEEYSTRQRFSVTNKYNSIGQLIYTSRLDHTQVRKYKAHVKNPSSGSLKEDQQNSRDVLKRIKKKDASSVTKFINYDEHGRVIGQAVWDAFSNQTVFESGYRYNVRGFVSSLNRTYVNLDIEKKETVSFTYDKSGQVTKSKTLLTASNGRITIKIESIEEVLKRDLFGRITETRTSIKDNGTSALTTIITTTQRYDQKNRINSTDSKTVHRIGGVETTVATQSRDIREFDVLGRAQRYSSSSRSGATSGVSVSESGTVLYGKGGKAVGESKSVSEFGSILRVTRNLTEIRSTDDFDRVVGISRNIRYDSSQPGTQIQESISISYHGASQNNTTHIHRHINSAGQTPHSQSITIVNTFNSAGWMTSQSTTMVDSWDPGKTVHIDKSGIGHDRYGRETSYTETTRTTGADGSAEDPITIVRTNIRYNGDGLVVSYDETNKDLTRHVTTITYDSAGRMQSITETRTWGDQSTLAPGSVAPEAKDSPDTLNGAIPGLSGEWTAGQATFTQTFEYDDHGQVIGSKITGNGVGTSLALGIVGGAFPIDIQNAYKLDSMGHVIQIDSVSNLLEKFKEITKSRNWLGRKKYHENERIGVVNRTSTQTFGNFDAQGRATSTSSSFKTNKDEWGWSKEENITYNEKGLMSSATVESFFHTYGAKKGKKYTADLHSKKDQTFEYNQYNRLSKTNDVNVIFDEQDVSMSGGGFFGSTIGKIVVMVVVVAISIAAPYLGPLTATLLAAAVQTAASYYQGAGPAQMWQGLAIAAIGYGIGQYAQGAESAANSGASAGGNVAASFDWSSFALQVADQSVTQYAIQQGAAYIAKKIDPSLAVFFSVFASIMIGDSSMTKGLTTASKLTLAVSLAVVETGLSVVARKNEKSDAKNNWFSAMLNGLSGSIAKILIVPTLAGANLLNQTPEPVQDESDTQKKQPTPNGKTEPLSFEKKLEKFLQNQGLKVGLAIKQFVANTLGFDPGTEPLPSTMRPGILDGDQTGIAQDPIENSENKNALLDPDDLDSVSGDPLNKGNEESQNLDDPSNDVETVEEKPTQLAVADILEAYMNAFSMDLTEIQPGVLEGTTKINERDAKITIKDGLLLKAEIEGNPFGMKDVIHFGEMKFDESGRVLEAKGTLERHTDLGVIKSEWQYGAPDSQLFKDSVADLLNFGQNIEGLAELLQQSTGVFIERGDEGEIRRVFLGRDDKDGATALAVEWRETDGQWKLLTYDNIDSQNGERSGRIFARNEKGTAEERNYKQTGTFFEGAAAKSEFLKQQGQVLAQLQGEDRSVAQKAFKSAERVHIERDMNNNLTREIGLTEKGQLLYTIDASKKSLLIFDQGKAHKFLINIENGKIVIQKKVDVTQSDLKSLLFSLPHLRGADTSSVIQNLIHKQDNARTSLLKSLITSAKALGEGRYGLFGKIKKLASRLLTITPIRKTTDLLKDTWGVLKSWFTSTLESNAVSDPIRGQAIKSPVSIDQKSVAVSPDVPKQESIEEEGPVQRFENLRSVSPSVLIVPKGEQFSYDGKTWASGSTFQSGPDGSLTVIQGISFEKSFGGLQPPSGAFIPVYVDNRSGQQTQSIYWPLLTQEALNIRRTTVIPGLGTLYAGSMKIVGQNGEGMPQIQFSNRTVFKLENKSPQMILHHGARVLVLDVSLEGNRLSASIPELSLRDGQTVRFDGSELAGTLEDGRVKNLKIVAKSGAPSLWNSSKKLLNLINIVREEMAPQSPTGPRLVVDETSITEGLLKTLEPTSQIRPSNKVNLTPLHEQLSKPNSVVLTPFKYKVHPEDQTNVFQGFEKISIGSLLSNPINLMEAFQKPEPTFSWMDAAALGTRIWNRPDLFQDLNAGHVMSLSSDVGSAKGVANVTLTDQGFEIRGWAAGQALFVERPALNPSSAANQAGQTRQTPLIPGVVKLIKETANGYHGTGIFAVTSSGPELTTGSHIFLAPTVAYRDRGEIVSNSGDAKEAFVMAPTRIELPQGGMAKRADGSVRLGLGVPGFEALARIDERGKPIVQLYKEGQFQFNLDADRNANTLHVKLPTRTLVYSLSAENPIENSQSDQPSLARILWNSTALNAQQTLTLGTRGLFAVSWLFVEGGSLIADKAIQTASTPFADNPDHLNPFMNLSAKVRSDLTQGGVDMDRSASKARFLSSMMENDLRNADVLGHWQIPVRLYNAVVGGTLSAPSAIFGSQEIQHYATASTWEIVKTDAWNIGAQAALPAALGAIKGAARVLSSSARTATVIVGASATTAGIITSDAENLGAKLADGAAGMTSMLGVSNILPAIYAKKMVLKGSIGEHPQGLSQFKLDKNGVLVPTTRRDQARELFAQMGKSASVEALESVLVPGMVDVGIRRKQISADQTRWTDLGFPKGHEHLNLMAETNKALYVEVQTPREGPGLLLADIETIKTAALNHGREVHLVLDESSAARLLAQDPRFIEHLSPDTLAPIKDRATFGNQLAGQKSRELSHQKQAALKQGKQLDWNLSEHDRSIKSLEHKISTIKSEQGALRTQLSDIKSTMKESRQKLETLKTIAPDQKKQIRLETSALRRLTTDLQNTHKSLAQRHHDMDLAQAKLADLKASKVHLMDQKSKLTSSIATLDRAQRRVVRIRGQVRSLIKTISDIEVKRSLAPELGRVRIDVVRSEKVTFDALVKKSVSSSGSAALVVNAGHLSPTSAFKIDRLKNQQILAQQHGKDLTLWIGTEDHFKELSKSIHDHPGLLAQLSPETRDSWAQRLSAAIYSKQEDIKNLKQHYDRIVVQRKNATSDVASTLLKSQQQAYQAFASEKQKLTGYRQELALIRSLQKSSVRSAELPTLALADHLLKPGLVTGTLKPLMGASGARLSDWHPKEQALSLGAARQYQKTNPKEILAVRLRDPKRNDGTLSKPRMALFVTTPNDMAKAGINPSHTAKMAMVEKSGWDYSSTQTYRDESKQLAAIVFSAPTGDFQLVPATPKNVGGLMTRSPEFKQAMMDQGISGRPRELLYQYVENRRQMKSQPEHIQKFWTLTKEYFGMNDLWDGSGTTKTWHGRTGLKEYLLVPKHGAISVREWKADDFKFLAEIPITRHDRTKKRP